MVPLRQKVLKYGTPKPRLMAPYGNYSRIYTEALQKSLRPVYDQTDHGPYTRNPQPEILNLNPEP